MKIVLLDYQNNYGNSSMMSDAVNSLDILTTSLRVLHNYFDSSTELFLELYLHRKNDFAEGSKILLEAKNNFVGILKIKSKEFAIKKF